MPTFLAMLVSAIVGYAPYFFIDSKDAGMGTFMFSTMLSLVTFAGIQWWLRRLRGDF